MNRNFHCIVAVAFVWLFALTAASVIAQQQPPSQQEANRWGHVAGRVVFQGETSDPALKPFQDDIKIYQLISLRQSRQGVRPKVIAQVPNQSLLIDKTSRGIANAFVYLRKPPTRIHPSLAKIPAQVALLTFRDRQFFPRAMIVRTGQQVQLISRDAQEGTNFNGEFIRNQNFNVLVPVGTDGFTWLPKKPEPIPCSIKSNLHRAAQSWALVLDHPYATLTQADGSFRLDHLPVGQHELTIWHEATGYVSKKVLITILPDQVHQLPPEKIAAENLLNRRQ